MGYPVKFGKYLLLERVNVGGMAEVFKAKTFGVAGFERILAIKRILPTLVEDDEFVRMFIDEARIAVQLNHANIAQIYELGKHGEHFYIAMEYLSSKDLRAILDKMRLNNQLMPIPQAAYIISKVCEGLDYAHRRLDPSNNPMGIIHRDVSPQNVLISYEGEVKIIDFGIAKAANRASKTQAGVLKGKFGYMSPEQVRGLPIDRRSDVFAVGVLLYEMLTGERLFIGESDFSTLERVRNAEVAPPTTFNKKITPELEEIVLKALAREVEDRFQWASELAEALQVFLFEERSLYNAKRLAAYMKETYNTDIASERDKMEQYLQLDQDPARPPMLPPEASTEGPEPNEATALKPRSAEGTADFDDDYGDDDDEDFEGEERTIVIEASEAGIGLHGPGPDDEGPMEQHVDASDPAGRPPGVTGDVTNDDYLVEPSLYGGDDDYDDDDDDAKTQVSFENPFAEDHNDDDPSMPPPPITAGESAPLLIQDDAAATIVPSDEIVPGLGTAGAPFDPVAAAMQEELSGQAPAAPPTPPPQTEPPHVAGPALDDHGANPLDQAGPDQPFADGQDMTPTPDVDAPVMVKPKKKGMGAGLIVMLLFGMFFAFALMGTTVWIAYDRFVAPGGVQTANATMKLLPSGDIPSDLVVTYNGEEVATSLPAEINVTAGTQKIEVTAEGRQKFAIELPNALPQVFVMLPKAEGGTKTAKKDPKPKTDDAKKEPATEPKVADATAEPKKPEGEATGDAPAEDPKDEGKEKGDDEQPAAAAVATTESRPDNLAEDHWRISFATIGEEKREPIQGAEVFFDGAIIGRTPFEGEFPTSADSVELEVRAPGFLNKKISVARGGRAVVGPATVQLAAPPAEGEESGDEKAAAADGENAEATDGEKVAVADAEKGDEKADAANSDDSASDTAESDNGSAEKGDAVAAADDSDDDSADPGAAATKKAAVAADDSNDDDKPEAKSARTKTAQKSRSSSKSTKSTKSSKSKASKTKAKKHVPAEKKAVAYSTLNVASTPPAEVYVNKKKMKHGTPLVAKRALRLKQGTNYMLFLTQDGRKFPYKVELGADSSSNKLIVKLGRSISTGGNVKATYLK